MSIIRIGTRASRLAVIQAELVEQAIRRANPLLQTKLVPMPTTGDLILDQTLDKIGGKGLFVRELDHALLDHRVDITVHSCKDLPMELDERLPVVAFSHREDPLDVLVLPQDASVWDTSKPVGCSSSRRRISLSRLYPGIVVAPVRGNVQTRLEKLDRGEFGALVLAAAGLKRLGLEERISRVFSPEEMLPAAGQGVLAVQARQGEDVGFLQAVYNQESLWCTAAERAFVRRLDGGCSKPCAAFAVVENGKVFLRGMYVSDDEQTVVYDSIRCVPQEAPEQAARLAERMKHHGNG